MNLIEMEQSLTKVLFKMEQRGICTDQMFCHRALAYEIEQKHYAMSEFKTNTGHAFKDSNVLFKMICDFRNETYPLTPEGNPSFNADALKFINTPMARMIKKVRNHEKRAGTYYSSFIEMADLKTSKIHANINQAGTVSGRMSYSNPNLQNVPKEEGSEEEFVVRRAFIPSPGNVLVSIDYSQQEYRLMLDYAGEHALIKQVMEGADVHQATADLLGITRTHAKTINFALLYGAGTEKLAKMLRVPDGMARDMKYLYFSKLPRVREFIENVQRRGQSRGYITNWLGRKSYIHNMDEAYKLPNHLIQGSGADICKMAMVELEELLPKAGLIVQVHDELLFDMKPEYVYQIISAMSIMERVYTPRNGMSMKVDVDHSYKSWATRDKVQGLPC